MNLHEVRRFGAAEMRDGSVRWSVWAPQAKRVELVLCGPDTNGPITMTPGPNGVFEYSAEGVAEGQRYVFRLNGGEDRADPCSLWQPEGVRGSSAVIRPGRFTWTDAAWKGIDRSDLVFYELHVGTFTCEGTFDAIVPRLRELKDLGVTALEIMPIAQFPGTRNWGYDGVLPYAAQNSYGGPQGFHRLIDACHAVGLAIFLDVVYNHFGPEGNFLNDFGPYFTDEYKTPWGRAINYDQRGCDPVREFILGNVRMWMKEFHLDGLRLDAVHSIYDMGARHILRAIHEVARAIAAESSRAVHIVAESDLNDPRVVTPTERGGHGIAMQWSDDFHHAVHAFLTGERRGYYSDFGRPEQVVKALNTPFVYAGDYSPHRGRRHGAPPEGLGGDQFVVCLQNHDQVGNRALGDRLVESLDSPAKSRLACALLLFSPYLPLLFMGEEYGERNRFPFFCSFEGEELMAAVRAGRRREFSYFHGDGDEVPDPGSEQTKAAAVLSWNWENDPSRSATRRLYTDLLAARKQWAPLRDFSNHVAGFLPGAEQGAVIQLIRGGKSVSDSGSLQILFNLTDRPQPIAASPAGFSTELKKYGGLRDGLSGIDQLLPFECIYGAAGS